MLLLINGKTGHLNSKFIDPAQMPSPPGKTDMREPPPGEGERERGSKSAGQALNGLDSGQQGSIGY